LQAQCARDSGIPTSQTKWLNIVFGFGCFAGKLVSGSLAEPLLRRDMCKHLYFATLFAYSLSSFLVSLNPVFQYLIAYMVFVGFLQGLVESLFFLVNLEIAGMNAYRTACGFTLALTSVSMTTGPPLAGKEGPPGTQFVAMRPNILTCFYPRCHRIETIQKPDFFYDFGVTVIRHQNADAMVLAVSL
jgi:MFS family permease